MAFFLICFIRSGTVLWGIISLVIVGMSWTIVGAVMGVAPKKKLDPAVIQLTGAVVTVAACAIMLRHTDSGTLPGSTLFWCGLSYWTAGVLNCIMLILMSLAMQKGPNGIIWAIIQSAMIFPFMTGMIFFNVEPKFIRITGLLFILSSLVLSGFGKENRVSGGSWKILALAGFAITGVVQNLTSLPSYFESAQKVPPVFRTMMVGAGVLTTALVRTWYLREKISLKENFKSKWLWIFTFFMQFFGLFFAIVLQYPGMDTLARCGVGSLSYPLLVGSCLVGFSLYSIFILREKNSLLQYAALGCCLTGIVLICL